MSVGAASGRGPIMRYSSRIWPSSRKPWSASVITAPVAVAHRSRPESLCPLAGRGKARAASPSKRSLLTSGRKIRDDFREFRQALLHRVVGGVELGLRAPIIAPPPLDAGHDICPRPP